MYRKTPSKRTGCNAKINSPAVYCTSAFTRAGDEKLNKLSVYKGMGVHLQRQEVLLNYCIYSVNSRLCELRIDYLIEDG